MLIIIICNTFLFHLLSPLKHFFLSLFLLLPPKKVSIIFFKVSHNCQFSPKGTNLYWMEWVLVIYFLFSVLSFSQKVVTSPPVLFCIVKNKVKQICDNFTKDTPAMRLKGKFKCSFWSLYLFLLLCWLSYTNFMRLLRNCN